MRRAIGIGLGVLAALVVGLVLDQGRGAAEEAHPAGSVRIGLIGSLFHDTPEPVMQVLMRPFRSLLEVQTGMCGELVPAGDADNLSKRLKEDEVQFGVFHGVEFAWARQKFPRLQALVIAVNQQPFLCAHVVVRKDSPIATLADLKGQTVALARRAREHCRLYLERRCVPPGVAAEKHFARLATPLDGEDALDDLEGGTVQAAIVDATELAAYQQQHPTRAGKLRTLNQSEHFPCAVVAYYPGSVSDELIQRFRSGMIAAQKTARGKQLLSLCRITRFEEPPADYEAALAAIVKAYPPAAPSPK
jgi:ABC-type phosphate/phosphonate transport system substrate-binding protein